MGILAWIQPAAEQLRVSNSDLVITVEKFLGSVLSRIRVLWAMLPGSIDLRKTLLFLGSSISRGDGKDAYRGSNPRR